MRLREGPSTSGHEAALVRVSPRGVDSGTHSKRLDRAEARRPARGLILHRSRSQAAQTLEIARERSTEHLPFTCGARPPPSGGGGGGGVVVWGCGVGGGGGGPALSRPNAPRCMPGARRALVKMDIPAPRPPHGKNNAQEKKKTNLSYSDRPRCGAVKGPAPDALPVARRAGRPRLMALLCTESPREGRSLTHCNT